MESVKIQRDKIVALLKVIICTKALSVNFLSQSGLLEIVSIDITCSDLNNIQNDQDYKY